MLGDKLTRHRANLKTKGAINSAKWDILKSRCNIKIKS